MTAVVDSTGGARAARAAGASIALAGDRSGNRLSARRHSHIVRTLKAVLPLCGLAVLAAYAGVLVRTTGWGRGLAALGVPTITAENLAMENPHYEGFNKDGGRYWVTAKRAMQELKNLSLIKLEDISGELIDANKERTKLTAKRGTFNNKESVLELYDDIDVKGDNGMVAKLTRATIKTKEDVISSDQPVAISMPAGDIKAAQMTLHQKAKEYAFVDNVQTHLKPSKPESGNAQRAAASASPKAFGNSDEPINITSSRLDVNDATKVAVFTGDVEAVQGKSTMTTPELEVTYEGSATAAGEPAKGADGKATPGDDKGRVKRVVAKNPVSMTDETGQHVTSRSADFDAVAQKAVLEGDVVMTEQADRRAVSDHAELDQSANTVLLTGQVVVTQGQNELRGRRLLYNRTTSKMNLTGSGGATGRISARFSQAGNGGPAHAATLPARGVAFGGNFKTDPNAPVDVTADRLDVDDQAKQAVFTGDVKAQQAGFTVRSAELTASYSGAAGLGAGATPKAGNGEAAKLTHLQAKKNVEVTSKEGQKATGDWADYDTHANTVTLGGDVVMTQGKNIVRGTKLVIDMTTGQSVISTESAPTASQPWLQAGENKPGGRPSAVFYPNEMKDKAAAQKPGAAAAVEKAIDGWQSRSGPSN